MRGNFNQMKLQAPFGGEYLNHNLDLVSNERF